jgi:hypothetical protein
MLEQGIIQQSSSAFSSQVLVQEADGTWRFCVDYRILYAITVKGAYPIPMVDELLDELHGCRFFSKLDLRCSYHQVRMHAKHIANMAFLTYDGLYDFMVMSFGLCNAQITFQALMNDILRSFLRRFVLVFFDDVLIYSKTWTDHLRHVRRPRHPPPPPPLRQALQVLVRSHLYLIPRAYHLRCMSCHGSGKVQATAEWLIPQSPRAVRDFLGIVDYYRKFIKTFEAIVAPLTALLHKEGFAWSPEGKAAFTTLKTAITTAPVLALLDFGQPFVVECDTSTHGFGAVLLQDQHPMAFFSRPIAPQHCSLRRMSASLLASSSSCATRDHTFGAAASWYTLTTSVSIFCSTSTLPPLRSTTGWANSCASTSRWSAKRAAPTPWPTLCPGATQRSQRFSTYLVLPSTLSIIFAKLTTPTLLWSP